MQVSRRRKVFDYGFYPAVVFIVGGDLLIDGVFVTEEPPGHAAGEDDGSGFREGPEGIAQDRLKIENIDGGRVGEITGAFLFFPVFRMVNDLAGIGKAGDAADLRKIFCQLTGQGWRGFGPFGSDHAIDAVVLLKIFIIAELFFDMHGQQEDAGDAQGQAKQVEQTIGLVAEKIPHGDGEKIFEHSSCAS